MLIFAAFGDGGAGVFCAPPHLSGCRVDTGKAFEDTWHLHFSFNIFSQHCDKSKFLWNFELLIVAIGELHKVLRNFIWSFQSAFVLKHLKYAKSRRSFYNPFGMLKRHFHVTLRVQELPQLWGRLPHKVLTITASKRILVVEFCPASNAKSLI